MSSARLPGLDRLRGLAIALMVVDHVLATWPSPTGQVIRYTATRASLPLFCVVAGCLATAGRPAPSWRLYTVLAAGVITTVVAPPTIARPDILLMIAGALVLVTVTAARWWRVALLAVGIIQPTTWAIGWGGYEPGVVLALVAAGTFVGRDDVDRWGRPLPRVLERLGRWPLTAYVAHLAVLGALWALLTAS